MNAVEVADIDFQSVSLACLERSVANSVHTSACIPLTIWAIAAIGLSQTHSHLGPFGVEVDLPNISTARSHYGVAIVIFRGKKPSHATTSLKLMAASNSRM